MVGFDLRCGGQLDAVALQEAWDIKVKTTTNDMKINLLRLAKVNEFTQPSTHNHLRIHELIYLILLQPQLWPGLALQLIQA